MKFDINKLLTVKDTDSNVAEKLIGKKVYCADFVEDFINNTAKVGVLQKIYSFNEVKCLYNYKVNGGHYLYIYPYEEPKNLIPFTSEDTEKLKGKWIKGKENSLSKNIEQQIIRFDIIDNELYVNNCKSSVLLEEYTFQDGTPCGKEKE